MAKPLPWKQSATKFSAKPNVKVYQFQNKAEPSKEFLEEPVKRVREQVLKPLISRNFGLAAEDDVSMIFRISAHALTVKTKNEEFTIHATSGKGEYLNDNSIESQSASYKGVTPVGKYIIKPNEFSDPNILIDLKRNIIDRADWGDWRVRLHNKTDEGFNYYGRDNFFLHGGSKAGSAGCIDIGGSLQGNENTEKVANAILNSKKPIILEVKP